jgi:hypothetical protein
MCIIFLKFLRFSSAGARDIYRNIENNGRWWGRGEAVGEGCVGGGGGKESGSHDGFKVQGPRLGGALRYSGRGWKEKGVGVDGGGGYRREGVQKEH